VSNFQQVVDPGPGVFDALSEAADVAFEMFDPLAREQAEREGLEAGYRDGGRTSVTVEGQGGGPGRGVGASPDINDPRRGIMPTGANTLTRNASDAALSMIRGFEGFRETPYWDVNALRVGYGSDTITRPDGSVVSVTDGVRVTREDAERDLLRRVNDEFLPSARAAIGTGRFDQLSSGQQAVLGSLAYNYGADAWQNDLAGVANAVISGDMAAAETAIRALGSHNDGINDHRRDAEADVFAGNVSLVEQPMVQIRTEAGNLELRDPDLFSGRYDRIRQTAAAGAYSANVIMQAQDDLATLRRSFPLNPTGFGEAADAYLRQAVNNAPEPLRLQLEQDLRVEAQRTYRGIVDARHRDTMNRANNESRALVDRYSEEFVRSLASGDVDGAAVARAQLESTLRYRENLPGIAWTRAQSENVIISAQADARQERERLISERQTEIGETLTSIRQSANHDRTHEDEAILFTPEARAHPDYNRTFAAVDTRNMRIQLHREPPSHLEEIINHERGAAIGETWENDYLENFEEIQSIQNRGLAEDPMAYWADTSRFPVPDLSDFDVNNPTTIIRGLRQRAVFAEAMTAAGWPNTRRIFTNEEREQLSVILSPDTELPARTAFAGMLIEALGPRAVQAATELGADSTTSGFVGLAARTGDLQTLEVGLTGQAMLRAGQAQRAAPADRILSNIAPEVDEALPPSGNVRAQISEMAEAYAAYHAGTGVPDADLMAEGAMFAIGYREADGSGGVQPIGALGGRDMFLPPGVRPEEVSEALQIGVDRPAIVAIADRHFVMPVPTSRAARRDRQSFNQIARTGDEDAMAAWLHENGFASYTTREEADASVPSNIVWGETGPPMMAGEVIDESVLSTMQLAPVMGRGGVVMGHYYLRGDGWDAEDADGNLFIVNLNELMERAGVR
jgi:GH24 family phage-related lysozyme (muramidase)